MTKVKTTPNGTVDRTALELNERLIVPAYLHLGARVGVDILELHVASLYKDVVQIAISGVLVENCNCLLCGGIGIMCAHASWQVLCMHVSVRTIN